MCDYCNSEHPSNFCAYANLARLACGGESLELRKYGGSRQYGRSKNQETFRCHCGMVLTGDLPISKFCCFSCHREYHYSILDGAVVV